MMSDKDEPKKPEAPASSDDGSAAPSAVPEVDAELVSNGAPGAKPAPAKEPEIDAEAASSDGAPDGNGAEPSPLKRAAGLSPGVVIFAVFALAVAAAFAVWRVQALRPDAPASLIIGAPGESAEAASSPTAQTGDAVAPAGPQDDPAPVAEDAPFGKISNDAASAAKDAALIDSLAENADGATTLPPPPVDMGEGNAAMQRAAKEALRQFGPGAADPAREAIDPSTDEEAILESATPPPIRDAAPMGAKIGNDISALKELLLAQTESLNAALDEERRRGERQAAEIASLREDLARTLNQRDDRAGAEIAELRAEIEKIRTGEGIPASRNAAASLALISIQRKADAGDPYSDELAVLRRIAPDLPALRPLQAHAQSGAPTLASLKERFPEAARAALAASDRARAKGPLDRFIANLQSLFAARPAAPQAGTSARAVISRAESRLEKGDLSGAAAELQTLDSAAKAAMAAWLEDAEARIAVAGAIDDLNALLLNSLQN